MTHAIRFHKPAAPKFCNGRRSRSANPVPVKRAFATPPSDSTTSTPISVPDFIRAIAERRRR